MNTTINQQVLNNLKNYINQKFKMIGFEYKKRGDVFTAALDDILTVKILCQSGTCDKCSGCNCENVIKFFNDFGQRYNLYVESQKNSVNGHFTFHQFKIFIKKL